MDLGLGDTQALLLATGKPFNRPVGLISQPDQFQHFVNPPGDLRLGSVEIKPGRIIQSLPGGHVLVETWLLGEVPCPGADSHAIPVDVESEYSAAPGSRPDQA